MRGAGLSVTAGLLVAVALAIAPAVGRAQGTLPPDVLLYPAAPCAADTLVVFVRGYVGTPCDSFISAEKVDERTVRIRAQVHPYRDCSNVLPSAFFSVPVVMGRFPAGRAEILLVRERIRIAIDGSRDTLLSTETVGFEVLATCPAREPIPAEQLPFVTRVSPVPDPACAGQPVALRLAGMFTDGCGQVVDASGEGGLSIVLDPHPAVRRLCPTGLTPWVAYLPLGLLEPGTHRFSIQMTVLGSGAVWPPFPTQTYVGFLSFTVPPTACDPAPLPFVRSIEVLPLDACSFDQPICPDDSIAVLISGAFPHGCYSLRSVEVIEPPYGSAPPRPPIVRVTVDDGGCLLIDCRPGPIPWKARATFGPLPAGDYEQVVEVQQVTCGSPTQPVDGALFGFTVMPNTECPDLACRCLYPVFEDAITPFVCSLRAVPGRPVTTTVGVGSPVALAGLEGELFVSGSGLRITNVEPTGPAEGMHLSWTPTSGGARFVMFADQGAPIPPSPFGSSVPVLQVTVQVDEIHADSQFRLALGDMLGSDIAGAGVPTCQPKSMEYRLAPTITICVPKWGCDINLDGSVDVRDLVRMVHCLLDPERCVLDAMHLFDCDGDGLLDVDDVLCCAQEVLGRPDCPECPADSVRAESRVRVEFGAPVSTATGMDVPIRVFGLHALGAAKVRLAFPAARFDVAGVDASGAFHLHQIQGDEVVVGLIGPFAVYDLLPGQVAPPEIMLHLALKPGQEAGGEVQVVSGDFSGPDGVKLEVALGEPSVQLDPAPRFGVSPARPNPFSSTTRFSVTMPGSGVLDVGVFDIAGRRVATVFRGMLGPGVHPFTWHGKDSGGQRAPQGVYFCRAATDGNTLVRRLVLLGGP